jgi:hypothetical protein
MALRIAIVRASSAVGSRLLIHMFKSSILSPGRGASSISRIGSSLLLLR